MSNEWQALEDHARITGGLHMRDLFAADGKRFETFHQEIKGLLFDYSKHRITEETLGLLMDLARARGVEAQRSALFSGEKLNTTEDRACLHMALRGSCDQEQDFVNGLHEKMRDLCARIRDGGRITDVVNIGVGGSDLGPKLVCEALRAYGDGPKIHFISNIDGQSVEALLARLKPENTLFLVASKTFGTLETITNARLAKDWLGYPLADTQMIALSENIQAAQEFGIKTENILPMRAWIGGRFSVWSATGLSAALMIGFEKFEAFLAGAHAADQHFLETPLKQNIPVLMAMIGVWYRNFLDFRAHCILPYADGLRHFPTYIQQLEMESNGKHGAKSTAPVVFGHVGTGAQHAFMQAFHQGHDIVPCDFIAVAKANHKLQSYHTQLLANALGQSEALMEGAPNAEQPHLHFEGNRPSSTFILDELSPYTLGLLMALYEHKVFVQGVIWGINSFDQWGVELGKVLARDIAPALDGAGDLKDKDSSTRGLAVYLRDKM